MKRRIGTCFLALAMLLAMLPASALAAEGGTGAAADSWENCTSCSPDNPHHISTKEDLDRIRTHVATTETETTTTGYFILDSDIAFSESDFAEDGAFWNDGLGFEPIGVYQKPAADGETVTRSFVGSFDGNGHTISGLQIANDGTYGVFTGLFGHFKGTVKDLTFQDCAVSDTQGSGQVGGRLGDDVDDGRCLEEILVGNGDVNDGQQHQNDEGVVEDQIPDPLGIPSRLFQGLGLVTHSRFLPFTHIWRPGSGSPPGWCSWRLPRRPAGRRT